MATIAWLQVALENLCTTAIISNLLSTAALTTLGTKSTEPSITLIIATGLVPFLCYLSICICIPSTTNDSSLSVTKDDQHRASDTNELWLILTAALSLTATVERYTVAILFASNFIRQHRESPAPVGIAKAACLLAVLELCVIAQITVKLWKAGRAFHYEHLENYSAKAVRMI
jgi:hypothetical protein